MGCSSQKGVQTKEEGQKPEEENGEDMLLKNREIFPKKVDEQHVNISINNNDNSSLGNSYFNENNNSIKLQNNNKESDNIIKGIGQINNMYNKTIEKEKEELIEKLKKEMNEIKKKLIVKKLKNMIIVDIINVFSILIKKVVESKN